MPASTPSHGYPYPVGSDPVTAYPQVARQFAEAVDAHGAHVSNELWVGHVRVTTNSAGQAWLSPGGKTQGLVVSPDYDDNNATLNVMVRGNRVTVKFWVNNSWSHWANGAIDLAVVAW